LTPASGRRNRTTSPPATTSAKRSAGRRAAGKVLAKAGCSAVRPREAIADLIAGGAASSPRDEH
jgi:hypothetical protein